MYDADYFVKSHSEQRYESLHNNDMRKKLVRGMKTIFCFQSQYIHQNVFSIIYPYRLKNGKQYEFETRKCKRTILIVCINYHAGLCSPVHTDTSTTTPAPETHGALQKGGRETL